MRTLSPARPLAPALAAMAFASLLSGCSSGFAIETIITPSPEATGAAGERGPFGVERANLSMADLLGGGYDVEVTLPVGEGAHQTPVILVQGGAVDKERYRWISEHLSTRGFTVLNAQHPNNLALFDVGTNLRAFDAVRADEELGARVADVPGLAVGHSLGGVVAAKVWSQAGADTMKHLVLLASFPDANDTFDTPPEDRIALSMWGTENGRTSSEEFYDNSRSLVDAASVVTVTIEGMNHYQFVTDPTEEELENDGVATIDIETAQRTALELLDWIADDAAGTGTFETPPARAWPEGVETYPAGS
jgi:pimeloyl-ACP methyl ester carboxylesterase